MKYYLSVHGKHVHTIRARNVHSAKRKARDWVKSVTGDDSISFRLRRDVERVPAVSRKRKADRLHGECINVTH